MGASPLAGDSSSMSSVTGIPVGQALSRRLPLVTYILELEPPFPAVYISPQMAALFGYLPHEFSEEPDFWLRRIVPEDRPGFSSALDALLRGEASMSVDYRVVARDGREVWVRDVAVVEEGHAHGFLTDVTREKELEQELADERAQAEAFFMDSPVGMGITDGEGRYVRVNEALARMSGVDAADHQGRTLADIAPTIAEAVAPLLEQVRRTGEAIFQREVQVEREGERGAYLVSYFPIEAASGERYGRIVIDITDQRRAELRHRQLIEQLPLVTYVNDVTPASQAVFVSPQIEELYGYPAERWLEGPELWDLVVHPADREDVAAREAAARASGEPFELEYRIVRADGTVRWVLDLMETIYDADGRPVLEQGFLVDVTKRRQTENLFRAVFEGAFEAVVICGSDGRYLDANPAACELFGYARDELIGMRLGEVAGDPVEAAEAWRTLLETGVARGTREFVRPDGSVREAEFAARANVLPGVHISVLRDVTERRQLERELWRAQRLESVGRLAGGIAQDFNNLLTAIRGYAQLTLAHAAHGTVEHHHAQEIDRAADRAAALTAQLLAFGRRQMLDPRPVEPNRLVEQLVPMLTRITGDDVELAVELGGGLPAVRVDPSQIEHALVNLVVNAAGVTPAGERVVVRTSAADAQGVEDLPEGRYVVLSVEDAGPGVDPSTLEHLFEPFFTTKEVGDGTGLGLATAYGIAKQSGGTIVVGEAPGGGAVFSVYLPEAAAAAGEGDGERILVVESDPSLRNVLFELLTDAGYRVFTTRTPGEALALAGRLEEPVDLVVTELGGLRARTLLDSLPDAQSLTLHKPYTPDHVRQEVRRVLGRRKG
jgi:two-component system, cell cycle sensor histidine kinase and response regulator CckA